MWEPLHPLSGQSPGQGVPATAFVTWALAYLLLQQDIHGLLPWALQTIIG